MSNRCTCCGHAAGSIYCTCRLPFCDGCDSCRAHCTCRQIAGQQPTGCPLPPPNEAYAPRPGEGGALPPGPAPALRLSRKEHLARARAHLASHEMTGDPERHLLKAAQHILSALEVR